MSTGDANASASGPSVQAPARFRRDDLRAHALRAPLVRHGLFLDRGDDHAVGPHREIDEGALARALGEGEVTAAVARLVVSAVRAGDGGDDDLARGGEQRRVAVELVEGLELARHGVIGRRSAIERVTDGEEDGVVLAEAGPPDRRVGPRVFQDAEDAALGGDHDDSIGGALKERAAFLRRAGRGPGALSPGERSVRRPRRAG